MEKKGPYKRRYEVARTLASELGPLKLLPGKWKGTGTGWNMISLPFDKAPFKFRVLMNQYDETLDFTFVDDNVPNRGLPGVIKNNTAEDQFVVTLDYQQSVVSR